MKIKSLFWKRCKKMQHLKLWETLVLLRRREECSKKGVEDICGSVSWSTRTRFPRPSSWLEISFGLSRHASTDAIQTQSQKFLLFMVQSPPWTAAVLPSYYNFFLYKYHCRKGLIIKKKLGCFFIFVNLKKISKRD